MVIQVGEPGDWPDNPEETLSCGKFNSCGAFPASWCKTNGAIIAAIIFFVFLLIAVVAIGIIIYRNKLISKWLAPIAPS